MKADKFVVPSFPELKDASKSDYNKFVVEPKMICERKLDGTAIELIIHPKDKENPVTLMGRGILKSGLQSNYTLQFPEIVKEWKKWKYDSVFLGELVVIPEGRKFERFNVLQTRTTRKENIEEYAEKYPATLILFDVAYFFLKDHTGLPFSERRKILENIQMNVKFPARTILIKQKKTKKGKIKLWEFAKRKQLEGVVFKHLDGKFGEQQYKYKRVITEDVYIKKATRGTGRLKKMHLFGALEMFQLKNRKEVYCGRVGSGFDDKTRIKLQKNFEKLQIDGKDEYYLAKEPFVIEVKCNEITKDGIFRMPRYIRERKDKSTIQCIRKNHK